MSDVLTVEEIQQAKDKHKNPGQYFEEQGHAWDWMWDFNPRAIATIETLQAQNKRLVEALEHVQATISYWHHDENCGLWQYSDGSCNCAKEQTDDYIDEILETLPAEALEAERRREEEIQALKAQANGLREALGEMEAVFSSMHYDSHDVKKCPFDHCHNCDGFNVIMQAREALEELEGGK